MILHSLLSSGLTRHHVCFDALVWNSQKKFSISETQCGGEEEHVPWNQRDLSSNQTLTYTQLPIKWDKE